VTGDEWLMEEATNQTVFREMNEWTRDDADRHEDDQGKNIFLCECGDGTCTAPIRLTAGEYEAVRSEPTRFALAVDHENPELDSVFAEYAEFTVIDKTFGPAARLARASNPRR
jgi:hypothetical protein